MEIKLIIADLLMQQAPFELVFSCLNSTNIVIYYCIMIVVKESHVQTQTNTELILLKSLIYCFPLL